MFGRMKPFGCLMCKNLKLIEGLQFKCEEGMSDKYNKSNCPYYECVSSFDELKKEIDVQIDVASEILGYMEEQVEDNLATKDMSLFSKKYVDYRKAYNEFHEALNEWMPKEEEGYWGYVDIEEPFDEEPLMLSVSPHDDEVWFKEYHEEFCEKFKLKLYKADHATNHIIVYKYILSE